MKSKRVLLSTIRGLVGVLFIISGLIKANDPLGLSYKMDEYFNVLDLQFLIPASLTLAILMIAFEILAGFALLIGFKMKIFGTLLLLLMIFFTFLTGYSYLSGKITECGCFGDCLPLTAGQSFLKDIILSLMVLYLFIHRKRIKPLFEKMVNWILIVVVVSFIFGIQGHVLRHLPYVDCLPYKVGNDIKELTKIPEGATPDVYESVFIYEKDGEKKEFSEENIPWEDSTWQYVDRKDKLVKKGNAEPEIKDFVITDFQGNDFTQALLNEPDEVLLFLSEKIGEAKSSENERMKKLFQNAAESGIPIWGITASDEEKVQQFKADTGFDFPFYQMDGVAIKTAVRNNPALILLKNGVIEGKWAFRDVPEKLPHN